MDIFSINSLAVIAMVSMPFTIIFGTGAAAVNLIRSRNSLGVFEAIFHFGWLLCFAMTMFAWPALLVATNIVAATAKTSSETLAALMLNIMGVATIGAAIAPFAANAYRKSTQAN